MTIKEKLQNFAIILKNKWMFLLVAVTAIALVSFAYGLNVQQRNNTNNQKKVALEQLKKDQQAKAKELAKQQTVSKEDSDISKIQFTDISTSEYKKSTCSRLENRPGIIINSNGCNYTIRAHSTLTMAVVFIYENSNIAYETLSNPDANNKESLAYINTYLGSEAKRYNVSDPPNIIMDYFGPFKVSEPMLSIYYRDNGKKILDVFNKTSANNKTPEDQYDIVHYVLLDPQYGGMAFTYIHRAFSYNSFAVSVFIHENLHLLGASDKYNNNDCATIGTNDPFARYNNELPGSDIMCSVWSLDVSRINDITAREIGWTN